MKPKLVAGNWKMHMTLAEGVALARQVRSGLVTQGCPVVLLPPFIHLHTLAALVEKHPRLSLGAQNAYPEAKGAFTGEVSITQLANLEITYLLIGHSERRMLFGEGNDLLQKKLKEALRLGMRPLICCGEPKEVREAGEEMDFVSQQLLALIEGLSAEEMARLRVAYEPIWAIGTGQSASPEQAQCMHAHLRKSLSLHKPSFAEVPLLYGGSVNKDNAEAFFACKDIDGALVGGASLDAKAFLAIVKAADAASAPTSHQ